MEASAEISLVLFDGITELIMGHRACLSATHPATDPTIYCYCATDSARRLFLQDSRILKHPTFGTPDSRLPPVR